eukprot:scaffold24_cov128-Cylindrotheca_fusiformis.AAC.29
MLVWSLLLFITEWVKGGLGTGILPRLLYPDIGPSVRIGHLVEETDSPKPKNTIDQNKSAAAGCAEEASSMQRFVF